MLYVIAHIYIIIITTSIIIIIIIISNHIRAPELHPRVAISEGLTQANS